MAKRGGLGWAVLERPKSDQERSKRRQDRPLSGQERLKTDQERAQSSQDRPKTAQERPREAQERSKGYLGAILARFGTLLEGKIMVLTLLDPRAPLRQHQKALPCMECTGTH